MMRVYYFVMVILFVKAIGNAQPPICGSNPQMTSFCKDACIICDIDGFTGRNNSNVTGQAPPGFCTTFVHHMQWIGFIAGTTNLTLEVKVSNCSRNQGLEIGLYQSLDCQNFSKISDCDTDVRPGTVRVFKNTVPLVIGQYYYFVMDGSADDICDWTIKVTEGSTKVLPLNEPAPISIPNVVCQNEIFEMRTSGIIGATFYNWTIDGAFTKSGTSVNHSLTKPGIYEICLDASNVCDMAPRNCKKIEVLSNPISTISKQVCYGECVTFQSKNYCETGVYEVRVPSSNGCDSIISFDLVVDDRINSSTSLNICEGDTLYLGNGKFFMEGNYNTIIQNEDGCNIYMDLALKIIKCNIQSFVQSIPVLCNGENSGEIRFKVDVGTPPFKYTGFKVENSSTVITGSIQDINQWITISGIGEGNYNIEIEDTFGNNKVINVFVSQPPKINVSTTTSDYNQYEVSCYDKSDGYIKILPNGGTPPFRFQHLNITSTKDSIGGLPTGSYTTLVYDKNDCIQTITTELESPDSLAIITEFKNPDCTGPISGEIKIKSVAGGTTPYDILINNKIIQMDEGFTQLKEGRYTIILKDKNGCLKESSIDLKAAKIPELLVLENFIKVKLGDSILLSATSNLENVDIQWSPNMNMACDTCLTTNVLPADDTVFDILVTSEDGCDTKASIRVQVDKIRSFIISNVITPNNDGNNDKITYFAGKDIEAINYLNIYDRWGNLLYNGNFLPNFGVIQIDWDAKFHGVNLGTGVYTWVASVTYIDGFKSTYSGSLQVLK